MTKKKHTENELSAFIASLIELNENDKMFKIYAVKNTCSERFDAIVEMDNDTIEQLIQKGHS